MPGMDRTLHLDPRSLPQPPCSSIKFVMTDTSGKAVTSVCPGVSYNVTVSNRQAAAPSLADNEGHCMPCI